MSKGLLKFQSTVSRLVENAKRDLATKEAEKPLGLAEVPAEYKNPNSAANIYQPDPFPETATICKRCQLEPVANFFALCYTCRLLERNRSNGRLPQQARKKYRFS